MKFVTCPRSATHSHFKRLIEVQAKTYEVVDANLQYVEVLDPQELHLVRRFSGVFCTACGAQARIFINGS
jgi:hypothetical protein